ncbi:MAG: Flp pilus assembly protein CpaB [Deltaproteobacteria bacterium]|nr:Flp pilus assembly protein CpaB [Deltaproteobacteria bacterium]
MNRKALIAGIVVAGLGVALLFFYMRRYEHEVSGGTPVEVLMVTSDLAIGEPLTADRMAVRPVPQRYVEDRHILASDRDKVMGIRLATSLRANQSLLWTDLATAFDGRRDLSNLLREGMRALTIAVGRSSAIVDLLRPGDRVDVLFTSQRPGTEDEMVTITLLQNVLVLAVGEDTGGDDGEEDERRTRDVSVAVTMEQATLLAHARTRGQLELTLRNPEDIELVEDLGETTDNDLIEPEQRRRIQRRQPRETEPSIERID